MRYKRYELHSKKNDGVLCDFTPLHYREAGLLESAIQFPTEVTRLALFRLINRWNLMDIGRNTYVMME